MADVLSIILADHNKRESMQRRLWAQVHIRGECECWPWKGRAVANGGYGKMTVGRGFAVRSHRAAWVLTNGLIPAGQLVCHTCDNPPCCNPAHLFLGSHADNTHDMMGKGRMTAPPAHFGEDHPLVRDPTLVRRGSENGNSRYTAELARAVYSNSLSINRAAVVFGVSRNFVASVRSGRTWRHVTNHK